VRGIVKARCRMGMSTAPAFKATGRTITTDDSDEAFVAVDIEASRVRFNLYGGTRLAFVDAVRDLDGRERRARQPRHT